MRWTQLTRRATQFINNNQRVRVIIPELKKAFDGPDATLISTSSPLHDLRSEIEEFCISIGVASLRRVESQSYLYGER
ncbi:MAG: hypothetical protein KL785_07085 [Brevundimonas sp.]|nr:hypothetical protein [Brevundimonas sp.]